MKTQKTTILALLAGVLLVMGIIAWKAPAANPLQNTSWKGTVMMPDAEQGVLSFKKDTLLASIDDVVLETGFYQIKGDTLTIKKISGGSPCI